GVMCALLLVVIGSGCGPTSYPADVFPVMDYQPTDRRLQPPRESPPSDAAPDTGSTPRLSFDDATSVSNPVTASSTALQHGRNLAHVNCSACHGADGHGDGPVASYFSPVRPVDFRSDRVRNRTDGQL